MGPVAAWGQTFTAVHTFPASSPPGWYCRLLSAGGALYGLGYGTYGYDSVFRINANGLSYTNIKNFPPTHDNSSGVSTNSDGAGPLGGVVLDGDTLYGTAQAGGMYGMGTVYSVKTNGNGFSVLRHFSGADGKAPYAELVVVGSALYGTTAAGGDFNRGTVFRLNEGGLEFAVLKSFAMTNGFLPLSGLTFSEGVLYGTTMSGGASNSGTVFSIHPDGSGFTTLKEFTGQDGAGPRYNLVVSGNSIYGTTEGGSDQSQSLVYQLSTDGSNYNILKRFSTPEPVSGTNGDGYFLQSGLALSGGTLFGATRWGGDYGSGVLFALRTDCTGYSVLRHFSAVSAGSPFYNTDGAGPGSLMLLGDTLYGLTKSGGSAGAGTLFALNIAPRIQLDGNNSGMRTNGFGFSVAGYSNQTVTIECSTGLPAGSWLPLETNVIGAGPVHFADLNWTNYPQRFYRARAQ
jgi:uncharacterized repeat protein (TIGR03803 family)